MPVMITQELHGPLSHAIERWTCTHPRWPLTIRFYVYSSGIGISTPCTFSRVGRSVGSRTLILPRRQHALHVFIVRFAC